MRRLITTTLLSTVLTALGSSAVTAAPSWVNERTLTCTGSVVLHTVLTPAGFGAPFHIIGSTAVFVPRIVTVNGSVVTIQQPGSRRDAVEELTCRYTDPAGLSVEVVGLLSGR